MQINTTNQPALVLTETEKVSYTDQSKCHKELDYIDNENENDTKEKNENLGFDLRDYNLIVAMPLFSTIVIYQPFIYFVIQLREIYGLDLDIVGLLIAAYHLCRVVSTIGSIFAPRVSHFIGTIIGMAGYACLIVFSDTSSSAIFATCNIVVGFSDAIATMYIYSKQSYNEEPEKMRMAMSYQCAVMGAAVIIAFLIGGVVFSSFGILGVAQAGIVLIGLELLSLIYFLVDPPTSEKAKQTSAPAATDKVNSPIDDGTSTLPSKSKLFGLLKELKPRTEIMHQFSRSSNIGANKLTYLIAFVYSFESISCGYIHTVSPLFLYEVFGVDEGVIGIIFSAASMFGSVMTFMAISSKSVKAIYLLQNLDLFVNSCLHNY